MYERKRGDFGMAAATQKLDFAGIEHQICSDYHLKVDDLNFYPSTGRITIDGGSRIHERGIEAFIKKVMDSLTSSFRIVVRT